MSDCQQQGLRRRFHVPPTRFNMLITSPYTQANGKYSKFDLDMRRKAEILKHQGPQKTTQASKLTRKERYAQVIRGYNPEQKAIRANRFSAEQLAYCDSSMNRVSSSASGVPGKSILLYLDKTVPLYKYAIPEPNYAFTPNEDILPYRLFIDDNVTVSSEETSIGALEILNTIPNNSSIFKFNISISNGDTEFIIKYSDTSIYGPRPLTIGNNIFDVELMTSSNYFYEIFFKGTTTLAGFSVTLIEQ